MKNTQSKKCQLTKKQCILISAVAAVIIIAAIVLGITLGKGGKTQETDYAGAPHPVATLTMENGGVITIELYPDVAPNTVANFVTLANSGFYDGLTFHRVISGFMIQGGDPDGNGTGGPGYSIKGEFTQNGFQNDLKHDRGIISMARANNPDSAGSQFFIMHQNSPWLDGAYAAFGKVLEGMDVVDAIASVKTNPANDMPLEPQVISSIRVDTKGVEYTVVKK